MKLTDRFRAALALDGDADPQARDEEHDPWATTLDVDRKEPDRGDIEDWVAEYKANPLIRVPTQIFTSDVLEPGYRTQLGIGEDDAPPTVSGYDEDYNGLDLDEALEKWLGQAGIVDGEFGHDFGDVLEKALKDLIGRRGSSMVETVYDDATEQNRIMGLRPFKVETVTAYTREGKSILLRPDDDPEDVDFESGRSVHSPASIGDGSRETLPQTPAGDTACYVQFDDVFGGWDDDEVRFAQDDVVKMANDADTAEVFGEPDAASVHDRAKAIRQQYADLDQALKAVAYSHWVAQVDTGDEDEAKKLLDGFDPSNPEKVNVVNYKVDAEHFSGSIPDIDAPSSRRSSTFSRRSRSRFTASGSRGRSTAMSRASSPTTTSVNSPTGGPTSARTSRTSSRRKPRSSSITRPTSSWSSRRRSRRTRSTTRSSTPRRSRR